MTRSLHTDPRDIRAARRARAADTRRSAEERVVRRQSRLLRIAGVEPDPAKVMVGRPPASVRIRIAPAPLGFVHPLGRSAIREVLAFFGPLVTYGLRAVEVRRPPRDAQPSSIRLASLRVPGVVLLYAQPEPPWLVPGTLAAADRRRFAHAGAVISRSEAVTHVDWPGTSLVDFMRFEGLLHEIGHHLIQHHTGKRTGRVMRTADHERRARLFTDACRRAWASRGEAG